METIAHMTQIVLLMTSLQWWWRDRTDYIAAANISIFYPVPSPRTGQTIQKKLFVGPDFFVVLDPKPKPARNSWVVENEGKYPDFIVEVLSKKTRASDRGKKKEIYEKIFRTPEYFMFDPRTEQLEGYRLVGDHYVAIQPDAHGHLPCQQLQLAAGVREGMMRFFTPEGELVQVPHEAALEATAHAARVEQERAHAEQERARVEQERARVEQENARLADKLRELGVDPDKLR